MGIDNTRWGRWGYKAGEFEGAPAPSIFLPFPFPKEFFKRAVKRNASQQEVSKGRLRGAKPLFQIHSPSFSKGGGQRGRIVLILRKKITNRDCFAALAMTANIIN